MDPTHGQNFLINHHIQHHHHQQQQQQQQPQQNDTAGNPAYCKREQFGAAPLERHPTFLDRLKGSAGRALSSSTVQSAAYQMPLSNSVEGATRTSTLCTCNPDNAADSAMCAACQDSRMVDGSRSAGDYHHVDSRARRDHYLNSGPAMTPMASTHWNCSKSAYGGGGPPINHQDLNSSYDSTFYTHNTSVPPHSPPPQPPSMKRGYPKRPHPPPAETSATTSGSAPNELAQPGGAILNPTNIFTPKQHNLSPNYARKCPQIFSSSSSSSADGNKATHLNLYMPTPKFSSDKFIHDYMSAKPPLTAATTNAANASNNNNNNNLPAPIVRREYHNQNQHMLQMPPTPPAHPSGPYNVHDTRKYTPHVAHKTRVDLNYVAQDVKYQQVSVKPPPHSNAGLQEPPGHFIDGGGVNPAHAKLNDVNYYGSVGAKSHLDGNGGDYKLSYEKLAASPHKYSPAPTESPGIGLAIRVKSEDNSLEYDDNCTMATPVVGAVRMPTTSMYNIPMPASSGPPTSFGPLGGSFNGKVMHDLPPQPSISPQNHGKKAHIIQKLQRMKDHTEAATVMRTNPQMFQPQPANGPLKYEQQHYYNQSQHVMNSASLSPTPVQLQCVATTTATTTPPSSFAASATPPFRAVGTPPFARATTITPPFSSTATPPFLPSTPTPPFSSAPPTHYYYHHPPCPPENYRVKQQQHQQHLTNGSTNRQVCGDLAASSPFAQTAGRTEALAKGQQKATVGVIKQQQRFVAIPQSPSPVSPSISTAPPPPPLTASHATGGLSHVAKKSLTSKPNYRELINQVYAMRNATSEQELNLKIIQKTLNVDAQQMIRPADAPPPPRNDGARDQAMAIQEPVELAPSTYASSTLNVHKSSEVALCNNIPTMQQRGASATGVAPASLRIRPASNKGYKPDVVVVACPPKSLLNAADEKPSHASPLDLSMRTVKTKADSTEFFNGQDARFMQKTCSPKLSSTTVPRVDFTPNFSLHTRKVRDQQPIYENSLKHASSSGAVPRNGNVTHFAAEQTAIKYVPTTAISIRDNHTLVHHHHHHNSSINHAPKQLLAVVSNSTAAAVSYAGPATDGKYRADLSRPMNALAAVAPPASSSISLAANTSSSSGPQPPSSQYYVEGDAASMIYTSNHVTTVQRKRPYLPDLETPTEMPRCKQARIPQQPHYVLPNPADYQPKEMPCVVKTEGVNVVENCMQMTGTPPPGTLLLGKQEFAKPANLFSGEPNLVPPPFTTKEPTCAIFGGNGECVIKPETGSSSSFAARIRTKAELKGFTFNVSPPAQPIPILPESTMFAGTAMAVKIEPAHVECAPPTPKLFNDDTQESISDLSWNKTCMNLLEQLQTNTKSKVSNSGHDGRAIEESGSEIPSKFTIPPPNVSCALAFKDKQDDRKPCAQDNGPRMGDKAHVTPHLPLTQNPVITSVWRSAAPALAAVAASAQPKKCIRVDREKLRMQQQKRIAARLRDASSSESDSELNKRLEERLKKPMIKSKARIAAPVKSSVKNRFSDCGSDTSDVSRISMSLRDRQQRMAKQGGVNEDNSQEKAAAKGDSGQNPGTGQNKDAAPLADAKCADATADSKKKVQCSSKPKTNAVATSTTDGKTITESTQRYTAKDKLIRMTRSQQKHELELQLANSKVLRNDKIVRNSTTLIKRKYLSSKYTSKGGGPAEGSAAPAQKKATTHNTPAAKKDSGEIIVTRLRSQRQSTLKSALQKKSLRKCKGANPKTASPDGGKKEVPDGNRKQCNALGLNTRKSADRQAESLFMEVYRYKRSLKVPPSLINIKHSKTSMEDQQKFSKDKLLRIENARSKSIGSHHRTPEPNYARSCCEEQPKSIIDVLHSRITSSALGTAKSGTPLNERETVIKRNSAERPNMNRIVELSNADADHSHPVDNSDDDDEFNNNNDGDDDDCDDSSARKRHFSIFETKILETKTRNESKQRQRREIIREIFVGSDRPASAPPEMTQPLNDSHDGDGCSAEHMTFEQKFEQFLKEMNEDNLRNFGKPLNIRALRGAANEAINDGGDGGSLSTSAGGSASLPTESNMALANAIDRLQRLDRNEAQPVIFKRRRPTRYLRRKGSSGFDYLRKKKRYAPSSNSAVAGGQQQQHKRRPRSSRLGSGGDDRASDEFTAKIKTEEDVLREIQKWVLTKGVGQSTMHKAARLGYIDVIVYCLDRMCMNPDQKDNAGYTPLHEACSNGWLDIARILLQYGANHSEAALSGIRPLHEASENDHEEIVRLLLSYGADPLVATYAGQTPSALASTGQMRDLLNRHLNDVSSAKSNTPWRFHGPWKIIDPSKCGCNILEGAPPQLDETKCDMSRALRKSSISRLRITNKNQLNQNIQSKQQQAIGDKDITLSERTITSDEHLSGAIVNNNNDTSNLKKPCDVESTLLAGNSDTDGELFEFEEADVLLPPLYRLKDDEGSTDMWVLLSDLCNLLKVKSKDTLLNKIYPAASATTTTTPTAVTAAHHHQHHKSLMRELKLSDFLEKAMCMQLLCAGEKFNICASKVVLIKYNENVRKLLGVKTILMKF